MLRAFVTVYLLMCLRVLQADWELLPDKRRVVHTCEGDHASFPWNYNNSDSKPLRVRGYEIIKKNPTTIMVSKGSKETDVYTFPGIKFLSTVGMQIKNVTVSHAGQYQCNVVFKEGVHKTGEAELKVYSTKACPSTWLPSVGVNKVDNTESRFTITKNASLVYSTGPITLNISTSIPRATPPVNCIIQQSSNGDKINCMGSTEDELTCTQTLEFKENGTFEIEVTLTHVAKPPATKMIQVFIGIDAPVEVKTTPGNRHNTMGIVLVVVSLVIGAGLLTISVILWKYGRCCVKQKRAFNQDSLAMAPEQGELLDENETADDSKTGYTASETRSLLGSIATQLKGDECLYKTVRDARSHIYSEEAVGSAMTGKLKVLFPGAIENAKYKTFNRLDQNIKVPRFVTQTHQIAKEMKQFVRVLLEHLAEEPYQDNGALDPEPIHVGRFEYDWKTLYLDDFTFRCIVQPIYKEDNIEVITGGPEVRQEHRSRLITMASHFLHLAQTLSQTPESGDSIIDLEQNESTVSIKLIRKCCDNHLHNIKVNVIFGYSIPGNSVSNLIVNKNVILQSRKDTKKMEKCGEEVFVVPNEKHWLSGREMDLVISKLCSKASPYTNNVFRVFTVIIKHFFKVADDNFQVEEKDNFCYFINDSPNVWILETILFEIVLDHSDEAEWGQTKLVSRLTEMLSKLLGVKELDGHMYWPDINDMYNTTEILGIDLGKRGSQLHTSLNWYLEGLEKLIDFIENPPDGWIPRKKAEVVKKVSSIKDKDYQFNEYTNHPWIQWCEQYHLESIASMSDDNGKKAQLVIKEGSSVSNQDIDIDELALMFEKMPVKNDEIDDKKSSVYFQNVI